MRPSGATVYSSERLKVGTRLEAINLSTDRRSWVRVAWRWPDSEGDGFKLGLELLEPQPDFWSSAPEPSPA